MSEWKFRRRTGACTACNSVFEDGARHASVLSISDDSLAREDLCLVCWQGRAEADAGAAQAGRADELVHWFTRHRAGKRGMQLDLPTLEAVFLRLEGRTEPKLSELRYLLCLLLMRKKRLKIDRILRGEGEQGESMLVHRPRRKESLRVWVYDFSAERMEALKGDLLALFEGADASLVGDLSNATSSGPAEAESEDSAAADADVVSTRA
ncbi:MAG: hypothetical protein ACK57N_16050 [Planctomycetia bacterium]|jgi:hypothetical protein